MPDPTQGIACPACGKRYYWEDRLARRLVQCACGAVMRMPEAPDAPATRHEAAPSPEPAPTPESSGAAEPAPAEGDLGAYELAAPPPEVAAALAGPPVTRCLSCGAPFAPGAILCLNCGLNVQTGARLTLADPAAAGPPPESEDASAVPDPAAAPVSSPGPQVLPATERAIPIALLALGVVVHVAQHLHYGGRGGGVSLPVAIAEVGGGLLVLLPLLLAGIWGAARLADLDFGPLGTALLKLLAITLAPEAIGLLVYHLLGGSLGAGLVGSGLAIALYWILAARLFHLNFHETAVTMAMIAVTFIVSGMAMGVVRAILT